jgi:hypothetical protein
MGWRRPPRSGLLANWAQLESYTFRFRDPLNTFLRSSSHGKIQKKIAALDASDTNPTNQFGMLGMSRMNCQIVHMENPA